MKIFFLAYKQKFLNFEVSSKNTTTNSENLFDNDNFKKFTSNQANETVNSITQETVAPKVAANNVLNSDLGELIFIGSDDMSANANKNSASGGLDKNSILKLYSSGGTTGMNFNNNTNNSAFPQSQPQPQQQQFKNSNSLFGDFNSIQFNQQPSPNLMNNSNSIGIANVHHQMFSNNSNNNSNANKLMFGMNQMTLTSSQTANPSSSSQTH